MVSSQRDYQKSTQTAPRKGCKGYKSERMDGTGISKARKSLIYKEEGIVCYIYIILSNINNNTAPCEKNGRKAIAIYLLLYVPPLGGLFCRSLIFPILSNRQIPIIQTALTPYKT